MQKFILEKHPWFPYIAWTMILGFGFFVLSLAQDLKSVAGSLESSTLNLEMKANQNVADIDFSLPR